MRLAPTEHKRKLAARAITQSLAHLGSGPAQNLLVQLGHLPPNCEVAFGENLGDQRQRFLDAVRRVERDGGTWVIDESRQQAAQLPGLAREIAEKRESRSSITRDGKSGGD